MKKVLILSAAIAACFPAIVAAEDVDLQVMNNVHLLTDLNGSPGYLRTAESSAAAVPYICIGDPDTVARKMPGAENLGIPG